MSYRKLEVVGLLWPFSSPSPLLLTGINVASVHPWTVAMQQIIKISIKHVDTVETEPKRINGNLGQRRNNRVTST